MSDERCPRCGAWIQRFAAVTDENKRLREALEEGVTRIQDAYELLDADDIEGARGILHCARLRAALAGKEDQRG